MSKQKISSSKNFTSPAFDTYIPQITDPADIESAFKLFMYGKDENGSSWDTTDSLYQHLLSISSTATTAQSSITTHAAASSNVHGLSSGDGDIVATQKTQTLSNKTLDNPTISGTLSITGNIISHIDIVNTSASVYQLILSNDGKLIQTTSASQNYITVPNNNVVTFPIGTQITVVQIGDGQTILNAASGVTLNYTPGPKFRAKWSAITLFKTDTNTWIAVGDLSL